MRWLRPAALGPGGGGAAPPGGGPPPPPERPPPPPPTGQDDSKFGFTVSSGLADVAVERAVAADSVELVGLHAHIGSQVFEVGAFARAVEVLADFAAPFGLPELSVGGGLGVPYVEGEAAPSLTEWAAGIRAVCDAAGVTAHVSAEPGRAIVAAAAVTLYRVGTIKDLPGIRTYVAVDGGMSDNPRPVLYGSGYETLLPRAAAAAPCGWWASTASRVTSWCVRDGCPPT